LIGVIVNENRVDILEEDEIKHVDKNINFDEERSVPYSPTFNKSIKKKKSSIDILSKNQHYSSLDELNVAAAGYFKEERSQQKSEELHDHDMDILKRILPDIKSLEAQNKRKLKINIIKLVDESFREASYNQNTQVHNIDNTPSYSKPP